MIRDIAKEMGFDMGGIRGRGLEDMFIGFMLEMFKNQYFAPPRYHDTTQNTQTDVKEIPEELKQMLKKQ